MNNKNTIEPDVIVSCLVVEDEQQSRKFIKQVLEQEIPGLQLFEARNLSEAESIFFEKLPRLLVLDINLPDGDSFELLTKIKQKNHTGHKVIFTTGYSKYLVEAFKFSALDYLLKPFTPQQLLEAVRKALFQSDYTQYMEQLDTFLTNYRENEISHKKIVLKSMDSIRVAKMMDIYQAVSDNNYTVFHLVCGEKAVVSQPLKEFENKLVPCGFMRVHQSHLVNLIHIKSFKKKNNILVLDNDEEIPVSQSKRAQLLAYFDAL